MLHTITTISDDLAALIKDDPVRPEIPLSDRVNSNSRIYMLKDGDQITIDAINGTIDVDLTDAEITTRKAAWKPRENDYQSGTLWKYAQTVGSARFGAVTHPGAKKEKICYADI